MDPNQEPPPLKTGAKASYGLGAIAAGVAYVGLGPTVLLYFLSQVVGVPAIRVGAAIMASLIIDVILDPLIGQWSDNLRSRWGRRHPFLYVAGVLWALCFYFFWNVPRDITGVSLLGFMFTLLVGIRVSGSLYEIPSNALVPELAPDYDKRTGLISYRWFFLVLAIASLQVLLNGVLLRKDATHPLGMLNAAGYTMFGLIGSVLILASTLGSALGTHSRIRYLHAPPIRKVNLGLTLREMIQALTNPYLVVVIVSSVLGGAAAGYRTSLDTYFYLHYWALLPQQIVLLSLAGIVGTIIAVLTAPFLAARLGKKMTMITVFFVSTVVGLTPLVLKLLGLMPANGSKWVIPILAVDSLFSIGLAIVGLIIISSMVADVVEDHAAKTGLRAEGLLFATNGLVPKLTAGIGSFFAGLLISFSHFPAHAVPGTVPMSQMRDMVLMFLPGYVVMVTLSIVVLLFYRLDRAAHERNLETIRAAAAQAAAAHAAETALGSAP
jgi:GPH family glycoside/pentoside/hexuronide:cation symporter